MEQHNRKRGSWWLVFSVLLLNAFGSGAGYFLLGRWKRAILFVAVVLINIVAVLLIGRLPYWLVAGFVLASLSYFLFMLVDSCVMARRGRVATGRFFQKPLFFVPLILAGWGLNFAAQEFSAANDGNRTTFSIPASSMAPTLKVGDYILTSGYSGPQIQRGDVVIFKTRRGEFYVKRVVGLPNEIFQMKAGVPYIDGTPLAQTLHGETMFESAEKSANVPLYEEMTPEGRRYYIMMIEENGPLDYTPEFRIPDGHVFVLGDNRQNSADSRLPDVGFVPLASVVRKAELIYWSADRSRIGRWVQ